MSTVLEIIPSLADIVVAWAAIRTVLIASEGLTTWKKQIKGIEAHKCAKRLIRLLFIFKYTTEHFRDRVFGRRKVLGPKALVYMTKINLDELSSEQREAEKQTQDLLKEEFLERWDRLTKVYNSIFMDLELYRAIWGDNKASKIEKLSTLYFEIHDQLSSWLCSLENNYECSDDLSALMSPVPNTENSEDPYQKLNDAIANAYDFLKDELRV